jgi:hypothetical protein
MMGSAGDSPPTSADFFFIEIFYALKPRSPDGAMVHSTSESFSPQDCLAGHAKPLESLSSVHVKQTALRRSALHRLVVQDWSSPATELNCFIN